MIKTRKIGMEESMGIIEIAMSNFKGMQRLTTG